MEGVAERHTMEGRGPSPPSAVAATVPEDDANNSGATGRNSGERDAEENERRALELKAGLHPLQHKFVFWYTHRTGVRSQTSYEDNIKKIMDFSTVEGFWLCYCHLARPSSLPSPTDMHLFQEGIRPLWEIQQIVMAGSG